MKRLVFIIAAALSSMAFGQEKAGITRIDEKIVLDGRIDEKVWSKISPLPIVQHSPVYRGDPTERTEVRLAYDDEYLYVAGSLYDTEKVQSNSLARDGGNASSDWFGVILDSYNDKENASAFFTTPDGLRWDAAITDAQGGIGMNINWNTYWDVETSITDYGWFAEFRIPLSSLRFQSKDGETVMGVISWRLLARNNEWHIYPDISPEEGMASYFKVSLAQEMVFKDIESKNPVYLTPYVLGGISRSHTYEPETIEKTINKKIEAEVGVDLKYSITSNLTLDASINTDFAQVEADNQEINLSRFSLFFPEKRKFFQERSSSFDFNYSGFNKVFHSRRIGINEGEQVRIFGGARLVGRTGKWDIGLLNMQTEKSNDLPSENMGVLRLRRQVFNEYSNIGSILTSRIGNNGTYNVVYGADGTIKVINDNYFRFAFAQSLETGAENNPGSLDPARIYLNWENRKLSGFSYVFEASHVGGDYNPGLGFEDWKNYKGLNMKLKYSWFPKADSRFFQHQLSVRSGAIFNNETGEIEFSQYGPKWFFASKSGYNMQFMPRANYENVMDTMSLGDNTYIPAGKYSYYDLFFALSTPDTRPYLLSTIIQAGALYDGRRLSSGLTLRGSVSRHLEFEGNYTYNNVKFSDRDQVFTNHIARFRALVMFNTSLSISSFIQYNSSNSAVISNIRFRYNPGEGHDLYLVYNKSSMFERGPISEINPESTSGTFMIKYNYTFQF